MRDDPQDLKGSLIEEIEDDELKSQIPNMSIEELVKQKTLVMLKQDNDTTAYFLKICRMQKKQTADWFLVFGNQLVEMPQKMWPKEAKDASDSFGKIFQYHVMRGEPFEDWFDYFKQTGIDIMNAFSTHHPELNHGEVVLRDNGEIVIHTIEPIPDYRVSSPAEVIEIVNNYGYELTKDIVQCLASPTF